MYIMVRAIIHHFIKKSVVTKLQAATLDTIFSFPWRQYNDTPSNKLSISSYLDYQTHRCCGYGGSEYILSDWRVMFLQSRKICFLMLDLHVFPNILSIFFPYLGKAWTITTG